VIASNTNISDISITVLYYGMSLTRYCYSRCKKQKNLTCSSKENFSSHGNNKTCHVELVFHYIIYSVIYVTSKACCLSYVIVYMVVTSIYITNHFQFVNIDIFNFKIHCTLHIYSLITLLIYCKVFNQISHSSSHHQGIPLWGEGMQLDGQFSLCSATVECPDHATEVQM
jgi:hypothetical protein